MLFIALLSPERWHARDTPTHWINSQSDCALRRRCIQGSLRLLPLYISRLFPAALRLLSLYTFSSSLLSSRPRFARCSTLSRWRDVRSNRLDRRFYAGLNLGLDRSRLHRIPGSSIEHSDTLTPVVLYFGAAPPYGVGVLFPSRCRFPLTDLL
jgi:hypothetical protein